MAEKGEAPVILSTGASQLKAIAAPPAVGAVGNGENGHIALNVPPADFDTKAACIVVSFDEACKKQQMGEGWFPTLDDVPKQAVSMTVYQIMQCERIVTCSPRPAKANAIYNTLSQETNSMVPATILKEYKNFTFFIERGSASKAIRIK